MPRWVLIGGAGLTGLQITKQLISMKVPKPNIIIADLKNTFKNINLKVTMAECDIAKNIIPKFLKDDIIIHLAARQYHIKVPKRNQLNWFREVNVIGTQNIITHCIKSNVKGLIFFSTDMVYGIPNYILKTQLVHMVRASLRRNNYVFELEKKGYLLQSFVHD